MSQRKSGEEILSLVILIQSKDILVSYEGDQESKRIPADSLLEDAGILITAGFPRF